MPRSAWSPPSCEAGYYDAGAASGNLAKLRVEPFTVQRFAVNVGGCLRQATFPRAVLVLGAVSLIWQHADLKRAVGAFLQTSSGFVLDEVLPAQRITMSVPSEENPKIKVEKEYRVRSEINLAAQSPRNFSVLLPPRGLSKGWGGHSLEGMIKFMIDYDLPKRDGVEFSMSEIGAAGSWCR